VKKHGVFCEYYAYPEENFVQYDEIWISKKHFKYTIDNYFNKVYYLNLDKDSDRNANMLSQFEKFNIQNYQRIPGLLVEEIPDNRYWRNFNVEKITEKYILGSIGCRNSHWRAVEDAYLNGYERVLIFEDDIVFNKDPNWVLENSKKLLESWDMLYYSGVEEHHFGGQIVLADAYALNRKLIEEIYYMLPTSGMEVDNFYAKVLFHMSYNYSSTGKYLIKKLYPFNTILQDKSYNSNIQ
jgi:GR25 family glycosyltransferase involved in LPS biosynthesis